MKKYLKLMALLLCCMTFFFVNASFVMAEYDEDTTEEETTEVVENDVANCTIEGLKADYALTEKYGVQPEIVVKYGNTVLKEGTDYSYFTTDSGYVGQATGTIKGKGKYTGKKTFTYTIVSQTLEVVSITGGKKQISMSYKKGQGCFTGFEMQVSTTSNFATIAGSAKKDGKDVSNLTVSNLKEGTKYYARVRSYGEKMGTVYYSHWSEVKSAKTEAKKVNRCKVKAKDFIGNYRKTNKKVGPSKGEYSLIINSIDKYGDIKFRIRYIAPQGRYVYVSEIITAPVVGKKANFKWKDSWSNEGKGTLYLDKKHKVRLKIKQTHTAELNRNTLALKKTVSMKYVNKKHALGDY